jgi:hypothetical protein
VLAAVGAQHFAVYEAGGVRCKECCGATNIHLWVTGPTQRQLLKQAFDDGWPSCARRLEFCSAGERQQYVSRNLILTPLDSSRAGQADES